MQPDRSAATRAGDGVSECLLDVEVEAVAVLVGLRVEIALVTGAGLLERMFPERVGRHALEELLQGAVTDLADRTRRELVRSFLVLDETLLLKQLRQLSHALERLRRLIAEQLASPIDVDLGECTGVGGASQEVVELIDIAEFAHHVHRLGHIERVEAVEVVRLTPTHLRELVTEIVRQLLHLELEVHVLHELVAEVLELLSLLGRHGVEHLLGLRHPLGHDLKQLVEGLRVLREEIPVALHESVEVGLLTVGPLLEHPVELRHHVLQALHVLG